MMTPADYVQLVKAHANMIDRVKRYGLYWNAIGNHTDIRERSHAVKQAFHEVTEALKEARLIMEMVNDMPVGGFSSLVLDGVYRRMAGVHERLELAWMWMTTDPNTGELVMDRWYGDC